MLLFLNFNLSFAGILDEIFKDVEVSGTLRYRYEAQDKKSKAKHKMPKKNTYIEFSKG